MQAVNAGVHRTYSMFVEILEKSPNFEDRGGECSPPLILYIEKGEGKGGRLGWVWKDFLFMMVSICLYLFFVVIIKDKDKKLPKYFFSKTGN